VINSHTDTIEPVPEDWDNGAPFSMQHQGGCYFGNGAVDTKGPTIAAVIAATEGIDPADLTRGISFWLNHSEENATGGVPLKGSREMVEWAGRENPAVDAMIVIEPTNSVPNYAHNGYAQVSLVTEGKAAHSSVPERGVNAIELMAPVIGAIADLRLALKEEYGLPMNIGFVEGGRGNQINVVAEKCRAILDYRCPPRSITAREVLSRIRDVLASVEIEPEFVIEPIPPFYSEPDLEIVALASDVTGKEPRQAMFYSDAANYRKLQDGGGLEDGIVVLGCGDIGYAHAADERIGADEMAEGIDVFREIITRYCGSASP
jgi:succinyl-diaminopimelate desuccinylase